MTSSNGLVQVVIQTIGTLHDDALALAADSLYFDLGGKLRNPHHDPAMRYRTGLDPAVREHVLTTPGANREISRIVDSTAALVHGYADPRSRLVRVTVACRGGRHRSVAIAEQAAEYLRAEGIEVEVEHCHINRPVVENQK
ncbi:RapZ C-terminal domain-containing protein [Streptomyces sp. NPDC001571]